MRLVQCCASNRQRSSQFQDQIRNSNGPNLQKILSLLFGKIDFEIVDVDPFDPFELDLALFCLFKIVLIDFAFYLLFIAVPIQQFQTSFVVQRFQVRTSPPFEQKHNYLIVELLLNVVHFHLEAAEVVQECVAFLFVDNPIHVGPILHEQLSNSNTDFFIFKAGWLLHEAEDGHCERDMVEKIGFIDLSIGEEQEPGDLIVATNTGSEERSLPVADCLQIYIYLSILKQNLAYLLETCVSHKDTKESAIDQWSDVAINLFKELEVFGDVKIVLIYVYLSEVFCGLGCQFFNELVSLELFVQYFFLVAQGGFCGGVVYCFLLNPYSLAFLIRQPHYSIYYNFSFELIEERQAFINRMAQLKASKAYGCSLNSNLLQTQITKSNFLIILTQRGSNILMIDKESDLNERLQQYKKKEEEWLHEKERYQKKIRFMEMELNKIKSKQHKKKQHKRTLSEEQTFIFNQTNYSSFFPIMFVKNNNWTHKVNLRSHLDSVRALAWRGSYLISSGEDCSLKVWEKQQVKTTVRQHLGPVYSICSTNNSVFTAGAEGVIRKWSVSSLLANQQANSEGDFHQDSIWDIIHSQSRGILITSSSDQSHKIISTSDGLDERSTISISNDTPTSIDWLGQNKFVSGYIRRERLAVYDVQSGKIAWEYMFEGKNIQSQTNKIQTSNKRKMIATAHQDHCIRFFDAGTNKQIKQLPAHSDSVTSVCFRPEGHEIVSCGHDGNLRIWDLRKYKCVGDLAIHMRKYDESALCLAHSKEQALLAVGGADGIIKLLHPEH